MTTCPTCNKPVDPLRARSVGVRDGKVVAYCSAECARAAESKPTVMPATPSAPTAKIEKPVAKPVDKHDSGPVIEILHEPASGVVTSARDERVPTAPVVAASDDDDEDEEEDDDEHDDDRDDDEPEPARSDQPIATPTEVSDAAALAADPSAKKPGKVTLTRRRDSANAKAAWDWLDDEPAEVRPSTDTDVRSKSRGVVLTLLLLALLGGGGFLVYKYVYLERINAATKVPTKVGMTEQPPTMDPVTKPVAEADAAAVAPVDALTVTGALDRAREVLRGYLGSKSPRVQRMAAMALSRTGDHDAIEVLASELASDKTDASAKPELAFALGRAGDKRGIAALTSMLGSSRRDDKLAAGRLLVRLNHKDERAIDTLANYLEVQQHRLSVAEALATVKEPRALKVLDQIRADDKASPDEKARAVIALGMAGKQEVAAELRPLLDDPRFNAFAAESLAVLHDEAARPVLKKQLDVPSLRVGAARALKRLDPELDPMLYLEGLAGALGTATDPAKNVKDTEQIQLAETILVIAGPASWSEIM
ncbi:MAG TPA: HEAT repeat domain-containing protein [Kofleriaceae bacterium]|nr:HEAT repeat domain-containing protein [Kofleriaceae bacterium]